MNILERNNVHTFGSGTQPMVFAHGFGCDQTMWRYLTPSFENDFRIVLFDYVGYGGSDRKFYDADRYSSLDGYVQDLLEVCAVLQLKEVIFVGHSVSAMIGMLAAMQRPDLFRTLIMLSPSACYLNGPDYEGGFEREELEAIVSSIGHGQQWADKLGTIIMGNPDRPEFTAELIAKFCSLDPELVSDLAKTTFFYDCRDELAGSRTPALLVHSRNDLVVPVSAAEYVRRYMQHSTLVQIDANGHFPQMSAPEATANAMWSYLYDSWLDKREVPQFAPTGFDGDPAPA